jgi:hypothetical protein
MSVDSAPKRSRGWIPHAAAAAFFAVLACVFSYPLVLNLSTHVPGPPGDNFAFVWNFWWFRFALASGASVFECPYLFAPFGVSLVLDTHTALQSYTGATLLAPLSIVAAHNVVLLAGLVANGIATYALAYTQVRRALPAVLAGVIFSTSAYVGLHLLGHFNLVHAWVLPVAALAWTNYVERPSFGTAALVGLAFAVVLYSDYYYFVYALLFALLWTLTTEWRVSIEFGAAKNKTPERIVLTTIAILGIVIVVILATGGGDVSIGGSRISIHGIRNPTTGVWILLLVWAAMRSRVRLQRRPETSLRTALRNLGWTVAIGAVLALPLLISAFALVAAGDYVAPEHMWRSAPGGVDVLALVAGNPMHAVYGPFVSRLFDDLHIGLIDQAGWIGLAPILIGLAVLKARPHVALEYRRWIIVTAFFLIWSAGPFLQIAGRATGIILPQFFARFVPLLSNARIPGRGFVMVMLGAALLCALAVTELGWRRRTILTVIAVALLDGLVAPYPLSPVPASKAIEQYLASDPRAGSVLTIPMGYQDGFEEVGSFNARRLSYQMWHERPIVGGYISRVPDRIKRGYQDRPAIAALMAMSRNTAPAPPPLPDDLRRALADDGIAFVMVVRIGAPALPTREDLERHGLLLVVDESDRELYVVGGR